MILTLVKFFIVLEFKLAAVFFETSESKSIVTIEPQK